MGNHVRKVYLINVYLGSGPIEVLIMKENIYTTDMGYYTASFSLILVFSMLFIVILGLSFRFHQVNSALKKEALTFKTSFMTKSNFHTSGGLGVSTADLLADLKSNHDKSKLPLFTASTERAPPTPESTRAQVMRTKSPNSSVLPG